MTRRRLLSALLLVLLVFSVPLLAQSVRSLEGSWVGSLSVQGMKLRLVFNLTPIAGGYRATMDSPDQGAKGIATDTVIVSGDSLRILMRMIGGELAGKIQAGDTTIVSTWSQSGAVFPIEMVRSKSVEAPRRPQTPAPPFPYSESEVSVPHRSAGISLAGTLTIPEGKGPHPAVVLITGSGPQDRDETVFGHKPFRVLADHLARRGISVLRLDDRGVGKSGGTHAGATSVDFAGDIGAAVEYLRGRDEIRRDRIGLIGHSEGGIIAPMVAVQRNDVAFIVLLAGPSLPGAEIIILQDSLISLANGASPDEVQRRLSESRQLFDLMRRESDTAAARRKAEAFMLEKARANNAGQRADSLLRLEAAHNARRMADPWMRFFLFYDPMEMLRKVRCPILALNGEKDLQVPFEANLRGIERAGKEGGNRDVTVRSMPMLNHLFQTATTGSPMEYVSIEETVNPVALEAIVDWIFTKVSR